VRSPPDGYTLLLQTYSKSFAGSVGINHQQSAQVVIALLVIAASMLAPVAGL
jgi:hypothetical protein